MSERAGLDERFSGHERWTDKDYLIDWSGHLSLPPLTEVRRTALDQAKAGRGRANDWSGPGNRVPAAEMSRV